LKSVQANARSMVKVFKQVPDRALRPFIQRFLVVEFPAFYRDVHLPDTSPVAAFSFRGRCRIDGDHWAPLAAFTGLRETLRTHEHCHEHAVLLATFTPVGAAAFLRPSLEEFTGTTADLAGILITADRGLSVREEARAHLIQVLNKPIKPAALRALLAQCRVQRVAAAE